MRRFDYSFAVRAPLSAVARFHHDTRMIKRLTPPPILVQLHKVGPMAEGSVSEFSMWFGPLPIRWVAVHTNVDSQHGFTDTQARGPLKYWRHTHGFRAIDGHTTRVSEHIEYEHHGGLRGLFSRVFFSRPGLWALFSYRRLVTRRSLETKRQ